MALKPLKKIDETTSGEVYSVEHEGENYAIYCLENGEYYVSDDLCTHGCARLSEGWIVDEYQIECPLHGGCFDIRDGSVTVPPAEEPVRVYPVSIEDGWICIDA